MVTQTGDVERGRLAEDLSQACTLTGQFVLRSRKISHRYFDKYAFESLPDLLEPVAQHLTPLVPPGTDALAGLELGGVPLAVALSLVTRLPVVFVRKEAKTHGTARLAEGQPVEGKRLLIVEDVVSTGGQIALSTAELRARGAIVDTALCVIDRSSGTTPLLDDAGVRLISLFDASEIDGA